ncbi:SDR family oxidoreductase [Stigmatella erecta]|uniref:Nucleoside-diphosphate-sugar epimerase n=1 Tax=Stigmatella erecta TaxID=83460 RepID=A0A1I0EVF7_9BACT|nr:aldehyde reductase [Stigmatella erecta]SET49337.1 Nucleoside-diphosphate-sugar epimerase [Stigmatella erecta]
MQTDGKTVLVTGASGFVAMQCIVQLLQKGYHVRGTVRSVQRSARVTEVVGKQVDTGGGRLTLVQADLSSDEGWAQAADGCSWVLHVASPVPTAPPKTADEVIVPARDGTLRVLRAAAQARVKRVVMTSSTSAILYGHRRDGSKTYDENDWSLLTGEVGPYEQSKTIAERAAWDFVKNLPENERFELVVINPGVVLGPVPDKGLSVSGEVVRKLLTREMPGCPNLGWALVDVRDVASAHIAAMTHPEAAGQRFIVASEHVSMLQIAQVLSRNFGPRGFKVPTRRLPDWVLKLVALFDKTAALAVNELGKRQDVSSERARKVLGWTPRSWETMVVDTAESMIQCGLVPVPGKRMPVVKHTAEST